MRSGKNSSRRGKRKLLKWGIPSIVLVLLIVLAVLYFSGQTSAVSYQYSPGECFVYQVYYESVSSANFKVLFEDSRLNRENKQFVQSGLTQSFQTHLQGKLVTTVLAQEKQDFILSFRLISPKLSFKVNDKDAPLQAEIIKTALGIDIFAKANLQGKILSVCFDPDIDKLSQNFACALLSESQFVLPEKQKTAKQQWKTKEEDPNGFYIALYKLLPKAEKIDPNFRVYVKTKEMYLVKETKIKGSQQEIATTVKPEGNMRTVFNIHEGYLYSLNGSEKQKIIMAGKEVAQAENIFKLKFLRKESLSPEEILEIKNAYYEQRKISPVASLSTSISKDERERVIQRTELGKETIKSLLMKLKKAESEGRKHDTSLYLKFKALIYLHPEKCESLEKHLISVSPDSLAMKVISNALGSVGHSQAQKALAKAIYERAEDFPFVLVCIQNLALVNMPTLDAENTLIDFAVNSKDSHIRTSSLLGLGNMARNLSRFSPERSEKLIDWLIKLVQNSNSTDRIRVVLLALGNSGAIQALPVFIRLSSSKESSLRSAAVSGLRWIDSEEVDRILSEFLTLDPEPSVRRAAVFALKFRKITSATYNAQKEAFLHDKSILVRLSVMKNLWEVHNNYPEVLDLIKKAAKSDPSKEVRKAASDILSDYQENNIK